MRKYYPNCGRCGGSFRMLREKEGFVCICKECGRRSAHMPTMWEAYNRWQFRF